MISADERRHLNQPPRVLPQIHGQDAAMIGAVGNVLANAFGVVVPFTGVWLHKRTGSWLPHLVLGAA